jgi:hypothetical protein
VAVAGTVAGPVAGVRMAAGTAGWAAGAVEAPPGGACVELLVTEDEEVVGPALVWDGAEADALVGMGAGMGTAAGVGAAVLLEAVGGAMAAVGCPSLARAGAEVRAPARATL